jgi:hypothetical protein
LSHMNPLLIFIIYFLRIRNFPYTHFQAPELFLASDFTTKIFCAFIISPMLSNSSFQ